MIPRTSLKKHVLLKRATVVISMFVVVSLVFTFIIIHKSQNAYAAITDWTPGRIIDDVIFTDTSTMSVVQIQQFLNSKVSTCDTAGTQTATDFGSNLTHAKYAASRGWAAPPYTCLKDYTEGGLSSSQIIYNLAQQYQINPQVLIVLLQKEQGLVTDTWPLSTQYRSATGYGCPDTAACDSTYYGFTNQVTWSAKMFRAILNQSPTWYSPYTIGNNNVQWSPSSSCGGNVVNIQNLSTAALYDYTPYQPNQAALNAGYGSGDSCSAYGNRNFYLYFTDWFGSTKLPTVFKVNGDPAIYVQRSGYKFYVPTVSILSDYGLSTGAQTAPSSEANAIPLGSTAGFTGSLTNIVKSPSTTDADGGAIYLINNGKRYQFRSPQQMIDFGFTANDATILPYDFILSINDGGVLSNYVKSANSATDIFQITNDTKSLVLDSATLQIVDVDNSLTNISQALVNSIPSANPIGNNPILINTQSGAFYLYSNNNYYYVPTPNILNCWNFSGRLGLVTYHLTSDNDVASIAPRSNLGCVLFTDTTNSYLMNSINRITVPSSYGFTAQQASPSDVLAVAGRLPLRSSPLSQVIQYSNSPVVWYLENGIRKGIPSLLDLRLLNISTQQIDRLYSTDVDAFPGVGIKFGVGQVVKESDTGAISLITSPTTKTYIADPDTFTAYGYSWNDVPTFPSSVINPYYPSGQNTLNKYMYTAAGGIYLMDANGCYGLTSSQASAFGQAQTLAQSGQTYDSKIFPNVNLINCKYGSLYIKGNGQSTVYLVTNGQKHPFGSWSDLTVVSQQSNPYIITVDSSTLGSLATGSVVQR